MPEVQQHSRRDTGPLRQLRLYGVLLSAAVRAQGQYRANLIISLIGAIAYQGAGFAFVWVVVSQFGQLGGWGLPELALLYGMRLGAHGLFTFFFAQLLGEVGDIVREGTFDRFLIRPLDPLLQVITRQFNLTVIGDLIGGIGLIVIGAAAVDVAWTAPSFGFLVLAVIGGALIEGSMQLAASALSFRLLSTETLSYAIDQLLAELGGYPLRIFPRGIQLGLTFVFPLAFIAYFPASVLLGRTDELATPAWLALLAPAAGILTTITAYAFWRHQSRHYSSAGH
ncbi:ABC transporter permease [Microlunatus soli]|uniref:ABC-2 type transport system permease protein n=1 Tax=Microlunatus soli TaxID=630515 RepID=A0A1H1RKJ8_9ACTN|nr:ABC-2 family transporter protein [Microlunatus soli]SDS36307.1 ABC-2 type transport system permease protein [Microlunatus soli]